MTPGDFDIDVQQTHATRCPAGREAIEETREPVTGKIDAVFDGASCVHCPHRQTCLTREDTRGHRVLKTTLHDAVLQARHRYQATDPFKKDYRMRAGIEGTNSELKRRHGLGKVRVRGAPAVRLAFFFKCIACNVKRMVNYFTEQRKMVAAMC
jgi:hypothetical protein